MSQPRCASAPSMCASLSLVEQGGVGFRAPLFSWCRFAGVGVVVWGCQIGKLTRAQTSAIRIHRELAGAMTILGTLPVVAFPPTVKGKRREVLGLAAMGLGQGLAVDGSYRYVSTP